MIIICVDTRHDLTVEGGGGGERVYCIPPNKLHDGVQGCVRTSKHIPGHSNGAPQFGTKFSFTHKIFRLDPRLFDIDAIRFVKFLYN